MTAEPYPEVPETAVPSEGDHQLGIPPGPIDPEERTVLDELKETDGTDVAPAPDEAIRSATEG
jgi:hypothetical protein